MQQSHSRWAALNNRFSRMAQLFASGAGHPAMFLFAIVVVLIWGASGPYFGYSDTWQLVINTGTTIVTFLMVFLIQNTQNRDTEAIQIKLDELIRANEKARNRLISTFDWETTSPEYALGYRFDIILRGRDATPMEK